MIVAIRCTVCHERRSSYFMFVRYRRFMDGSYAMVFYIYIRSLAALHMPSVGQY